MKVFISGFSEIRCFEKYLQDKLKTLMKDNICIITTNRDCERRIQEYLTNYGYENVEIFAFVSGRESDKHSWMNKGKWQEQVFHRRQFECDLDVTLFREIAQTVDYGIIEWNGVTKENLAAIMMLLAAGKKCEVYFSKSETFRLIAKPDDLLPFVGEKKEIGSKPVIKALKACGIKAKLHSDGSLQSYEEIAKKNQKDNGIPYQVFLICKNLLNYKEHSKSELKKAICTSSIELQYKWKLLKELAESENIYYEMVESLNCIEKDDNKLSNYSSLLMETVEHSFSKAYQDVFWADRSIRAVIGKDSLLYMHTWDIMQLTEPRQLFGPMGVFCSLNDAEDSILLNSSLGGFDDIYVLELWERSEKMDRRGSSATTPRYEHVFNYYYTDNGLCGFSKMREADYEEYYHPIEPVRYKEKNMNYSCLKHAVESA